MTLEKTFINLKKRRGYGSLNESPFHNQHYLINIIETYRMVKNQKVNYGHTNTYNGTTGFVYTPYIPTYITVMTNLTSSSDWTISSRYSNQVNNSYYGTVTITSTSSNITSLND